MHEEIIHIDAAPCMTVAQIKELITEEEGIPAYQQILTYAGRVLPDAGTVCHLRIPDCSTLQLSLRLPGGMQVNSRDHNSVFCVRNVKKKLFIQLHYYSHKNASNFLKFCWNRKQRFFVGLIQFYLFVGS